jgi:2,4-dienoyl-CoA reductase-like NADH-dependent reductase (Old Yellow Enzyme family)
MQRSQQKPKPKPEENAMANVNKWMIDPRDAVLLLIDHQSGLFQLVKDIELPVLRSNVTALAKVAHLVKIPTITTASVPDGPNGPLIPEIQQCNPEAVHVPRTGQINAWDNPGALATSEIPRVVEDYRRAAERAKEAGFDGVEVPGANGYLIDTFLQSKTNQRIDEYGGSVANRYRFLKDVIEAVTSVWPAHRVGVHLSPNGSVHDMGSPDNREQFTFVPGELDRFGLAYLHVVDGLAIGFHKLGEPMTLAEFRKVFHGPLVGNGGYTKETAERAIAAGDVELISFGRPFISNPDLVERFRNDWPLGPSRAPVARRYSAGASRICSPRIPAEMDTTSNSSIVSSTYTG